MTGEPRAGPGLLVAGMIVEDDVDGLLGGHFGFEGVEEPDEPLMPVPITTLFAALNVLDGSVIGRSIQLTIWASARGRGPRRPCCFSEFRALIESCGGVRAKFEPMIRTVLGETANQLTATKLAIIGNQALAMRNFRGALIAELVTAGVEVFALAPDYSDDDRRAIERLGARPVDYHIRRAEIDPVGDLRAMVQLVVLLGEIRPDLVLSFAAKPVIYGTLAAWIARVPRRFALMEGLGHVFIDELGLRSGALRWVVSRLYRLALTVAARTLFLNDDDRAEFVAARLVSSRKTVTVGAIGVDLAAWAEAPAVIAPLTFIFVGRLLREKGIFEFIDAARVIKAAHPDVGFIVLGSPDSNPSSIKAELVAGWAEEGLITWPGYVDARPWLARSSVFVLPSYREGLPRSTQEAMALGKPVITTDVPGCRDTVVDGDNGFLVPSRDATTLQAAMLRFVTDRRLIATMGARSRQMAEASFDVNAANARMMNVMGVVEENFTATGQQTTR